MCGCCIAGWIRRGCAPSTIGLQQYLDQRRVAHVVFGDDGTARAAGDQAGIHEMPITDVPTADEHEHSPVGTARQVVVLHAEEL